MKTSKLEVRSFPKSDKMQLRLRAGSLRLGAGGAGGREGAGRRSNDTFTLKNIHHVAHFQDMRF